MKNVPKITLHHKQIKKFDKILISYYCDFFWIRILKLDDSHILKIMIFEPDNNKGESEIFAFRNCDSIENYLLELDNSLIVNTVYKKMMEFLNFSNEDISKCKKISISYIETVDHKEQVRAKILLTKGIMQEYAVLENNETFHVFKNGDWRYLSDSGIGITSLEKNNHLVSITGFEEDINIINQSEIMNYVKARISKLFKFVK